MGVERFPQRPPEFSEQGKPQIHGMTISVVITCACGSTVPLLHTIAPGVMTNTTCPRCAGTLWLNQLVFKREGAQGEINAAMSVAYLPPTIARPSVIVPGT